MVGNIDGTNYKLILMINSNQSPIRHGKYWLIFIGKIFLYKEKCGKHYVNAVVITT
jgi:hypothetical protein